MILFCDEDIGRRIPNALKAIGCAVHSGVRYWRGEDDIIWLTEVGRKGWLVLSCNKKILEVPLERETLEKEKVGMLTGGIGITPLRSMCRYCTDKGSTTDIFLIYGNRREEDIVFLEELEKMQEQNSNLRIVFTLSEPSGSWVGNRGRISASMVKKEIPGFMERNFYVCGPPGMVAAMEELLKELGLPREQVIKEEFPGYE